MTAAAASAARRECQQQQVPRLKFIPALVFLVRKITDATDDATQQAISTRGDTGATTIEAS
jgi:hypothetical protein